MQRGTVTDILFLPPKGRLNQQNSHYSSRLTLPFSSTYHLFSFSGALLWFAALYFSKKDCLCMFSFQDFSKRFLSLQLKKEYARYAGITTIKILMTTSISLILTLFVHLPIVQSIYNFIICFIRIRFAYTKHQYTRPLWRSSCSHHYQMHSSCIDRQKKRICSFAKIKNWERKTNKSLKISTYF